MKKFRLAGSLPLLVLALAGSAMLLCPQAVLAQGKKVCDTAETLRDVGGPPGLKTALQRSFAFEQCSSVMRVLKMLSYRPKPGGRDLTAPKPLDARAAAEDLQRLRNDPEYVRLLAEASAGETDPVRLKFIQAATLDMMGEYRARDLVIEQIVGGG